MHNIKVQRFLISHLLTSFSQQQTDDFHTHIYIQRERERERERVPSGKQKLREGRPEGNHLICSIDIILVLLVLFCQGLGPIHSYWVFRIGYSLYPILVSKIKHVFASQCVQCKKALVKIFTRINQGRNLKLKKSSQETFYLLGYIPNVIGLM